ncbi:melatonin receptor type 1B-B-like [Glandiceps talaboti]
MGSCKDIDKNPTLYKPSKIHFLTHSNRTLRITLDDLCQWQKNKTHTDTTVSLVFMAMAKLNNSLNVTDSFFSGEEVNHVRMRLPPIWVTLFTGSLEVTFVVLALVGNVAFVFAVLVKKKLRTINNLYLVNLSFTDIIAAIFAGAFTSDSFFRRGWRYGHDFCVFHNILHPALLNVSCWLTCITAINRYIYIVHNKYYSKLTSKVMVTLSLLFAWCFSCAWSSVHVTRTSTYIRPAFRCRSISILVASSLKVYLPCILALIAYILIFVYVRKSKLRVQSHTGTQGPSRQEIQMLKVLLFVLILVCMGYLPFIILINVYNVLYPGTRPPPEAIVLLYPCLHLAGAINPLLYGWSNKNVRNAYIEILTGKIFFKKTPGRLQNQRTTSNSVRENTISDNQHGQVYPSEVETPYGDISSQLRFNP